MASLEWGKARQLVFFDNHEYYQALGSLCHPGAYTITFETNSETDSWGDAFRIKCLMPDSKTPTAFINAMKTARRINCNDYVICLYENHGFDFNEPNKVLTGDYVKVKQTVPSNYQKDFEDGFNFIFVRYDKSEPIKGDHRVHSSLGKEARETQKPKQGAPQIMAQKEDTIKREPFPLSIGQVLSHKSFGKGEVCSVEGNHVRVRFEDNSEKTFANPDAILKGFLAIV